MKRNLTHSAISTARIRIEHSPEPNPSGRSVRKGPVGTSALSTVSGADAARGTTKCRPTKCRHPVDHFPRGTSRSHDLPAIIRRTRKAWIMKTSTPGGPIHGEATTFGIPRPALLELTATLTWHFIRKLTDSCPGTRHTGDRPWQAWRGCHHTLATCQIDPALLTVNGS